MLNLLVLPPDVVAGQVDVLPAQRREMWQQSLVDVLARVPQPLDGPLQVDGVPQDDRRHHQVEAARTVALVLETAVADFTEPVQEHGAGQCVLGFTLVMAQ